MSSMKSSLLLIVPFALAGCASAPQVVYQPPQLPPLPPQIAKKQEVNLTERLTQLLMPSEQPSKPLPK
jgi:uncharacterized lipoprotein YmbA